MLWSWVVLEDDIVSGVLWYRTLLTVGHFLSEKN
jgi:hypothetical protein